MEDADFLVGSHLELLRVLWRPMVGDGVACRSGALHGRLGRCASGLVDSVSTVRRSVGMACHALLRRKHLALVA